MDWEVEEQKEVEEGEEVKKPEGTESRGELGEC